MISLWYIVSNDINVWDVLSVKFWLRFKWIFNKDVNNEIVSVTRVFISFTDLFLSILSSI